jgi:hypothetical protein
VTNDKPQKEESFRRGCGKLSSSFRDLLFGAEVAEVNVPKHFQVIGRSFGATSPTRGVIRVTRINPRYLFLVVFFLEDFLAAFFFAITWSPPFLAGNKCTLLKILSQRFF